VWREKNIEINAHLFENESDNMRQKQLGKISNDRHMK